MGNADYELDFLVHRHAVQRAERLEEQRQGVDLHSGQREQRQHARQLRQLLENRLLPVAAGALDDGFGGDERELTGALDDGVLRDGGQNEDAVVEGCELQKRASEVGVGLEEEGLEVVLHGGRAAKQIDHRFDPDVRRRAGVLVELGETQQRGQGARNERGQTHERDQNLHGEVVEKLLGGLREAGDHVDEDFVGNAGTLAQQTHQIGGAGQVPRLRHAPVCT